MARKPISKKLRFKIMSRDHFTCQYCGARAPQTKMQIDHVNPVAGGGENEEWNLVTACEDCNSGKGSDYIEAFIEHDQSIRFGLVKAAETVFYVPSRIEIMSHIDRLRSINISPSEIAAMMSTCSNYGEFCNKAQMYFNGDI